MYKKTADSFIFKWFTRTASDSFSSKTKRLAFHFAMILKSISFVLLVILVEKSASQIASPCRFPGGFGCNTDDNGFVWRPSPGFGQQTSSANSEANSQASATTSQGDQTAKPCRLKKFQNGLVCVCTNDYCDTLKVPVPGNNSYVLATSTESGERFNITEGKFVPLGDFGIVKNYDVLKTYVKIERPSANQSSSLLKKTNREIIGFGAAVTGSVAIVLNKLSSNLKNCVYKSFYSKDDGLDLNLMRMSIGGSDFDEYPWAYNEYPINDTKLSNFTLHPVDVQRVKLIHDLVNVTSKRDIKFLASVWSPPRWMKTRYNWTGFNNNFLAKEHYQTYADYHIKFINLMNSSGIPIWAIATGNNPIIGHLTDFLAMPWVRLSH